MSCRGSATTTRHESADVRITVAPAHTHTEPDGQHWFSYNITLENCGGCAVRLLSRYWRITDGDGKVREVIGDGVVGKQPAIPPDGAFAYTSYVDFFTPVGFMQGHYVMETEAGERFQAAIGTFSLSVDGAVH